LPSDAADHNDRVAAAATIERVSVAMGTSLRMQVTAENHAMAVAAYQRGVLAIEAVAARLATRRDDSELARLNRLPVGGQTNLSGALLEDLRKARWWQRATGGAFDPAIGALVELYQLHADGRGPSDEEVWAALPHCGLQQLQIIHRSASRRSRRLRIESRGFAVGAALDAAQSAMLAAGALAVDVDLGGQVVRGGALKSSRDHAVADPRDRSRAVLTVRIEQGSLATTAIGQPPSRVGERDFGHVLDPRTGRPAADFGSMTVWASDAFAANCLSTGLFVMGPDQALEWAEQQDGIEVLVLETGSVSGQAERIIARMSSGLRDRVTALVADIILE